MIDFCRNFPIEMNRQRIKNRRANYHISGKQDYLITKLMKRNLLQESKN